MKKKLLFALTGFILTSSLITAQVSKVVPSKSASSVQTGATGINPAKSSFIQHQDYLSASSLKDFKSYYGDSLDGFDEAATSARLLGNHIAGQEYINCINSIKRDYIKQKYGMGFTANARSAGSNAAAQAAHGGRQIGGNNVVSMAPCVNEGFESTPSGAYLGTVNATAIQGWSIASCGVLTGTCAVQNWTLGAPELWILTTPVLNVTAIGTIPQSPLGGSQIIKMQDDNAAGNGLETKISQNFPVTSANTVFQFAYAGAWQDGGHGCCTQPALSIAMYDCNGQPLTCSALNLNAAGSGCPSGAPGYSTTVVNGTNVSWTNWQVRYIDLTPYVGSCITIEIINADCTAGGHWGMLFLDAACGGQVVGTSPPGGGGTINSAVSYCAGSNQAVIVAPNGYASYQWSGPTGAIPASQGGTSPSLPVPNPVPGTIYTVTLISQSGCVYTSTNVINTSTITIAAIGAGSTCLNGSSGTATVVGYGSGTGYTYNWQNSVGTTVGTTSVLTGVPAGIYTITLGAAGTAGCGIASTTVQVGVTPTPTLSLQKPYCGAQAYLAAPNAGSNFQWYNGNVPISAGFGGTASSYTANSPCNGCIYWLSYNSVQGCHDSIQFILYPGVSGLLTIPDPGIVCPGGSNATPTIVLQPSPGSPTGLNGYTVTGTSPGSTYSSAVSGVFSYTYNPTGLSAGSYSINGFDGSCYYTNSFVVPTLNFNYIISPAAYTLCSGFGNNVNLNLVFPTPPATGQYIYSWTPSTFLSGTAQNVVIVTPTTAPGNITTTIYTVTATSTLASCPVTHTVAITAINPAIPSFEPIPNMCDNLAALTISATPGGGTFSTSYNPGTLVGASSGIITPANALLGTNTFSYTFGIPTGINGAVCKATSVGTFQVNHYNTPLLTGGIAPICVTGGTVDLMSLVQNTTTGVWGGSGVSGGAGSYIFNPAALQTSTYTLTYSTLSQPNPTVCPDQSTLQVAVTNTLHPTITTPTLFCTNHVPFTMTATPAGGGWTGAGIPTTGAVTPSQLSSGSIPVTYTVAVGACINSAFVTLNISQFNSAVLTGAVPDLCVNNNPFDLSTISQNAGTWSGLGTSLSQPGFLNPGIFLTSPGTNTTVLTHYCVSTPNATLCPDTQTIVATVLTPATPTIVPAGPVCNTGNAFQLSVSPGTGSWVASQYMNASGLFTPSLSLIGSNAVTYVVGNNTCSAQQTQYINVEAFVSAATTTPNISDQCSSNNMVNLTPYSITGAGYWSGPGISNGITFDPSSVGAGVFTLVHNTSSSPSGLCPDQATVSVHVYSLQAPELGNIGPLCSAAPVVLFHPNPPGGSFSGINNSAVNPVGLFNPAQGVQGANVVSYSVTQGPCTAYAQATVIIEKFVSADIISYPNPSYCKNDKTPLNLNQFVANLGGEWYGPGTTSSGMMTFANANVGSNNIVHYKITSKPDGLCVDTSDLRINIIDVPQISITADPPTGCAPQAVTLNMPNTNVVDGSVLWDFGDGIKNNTNLNPTHTYSTAGTYSVVFTLAGSCTVQAVLGTPIVVVDKPKANFTVPEEVGSSNTDIQVNNLTQGSNTYQWQVTSLNTLLTGPSPSFMLPAVPGRYNVTLTVKNIGGCIDEMTKVIEVKNEFHIWIPNTFTPNSDDLNEEFIPVFTPYGLDASTFEMQVYDRWGTLLFQTKDVRKGWNGTVQNKGTEQLKEDVYVYKVKYKDMDGNVYNKIGYVNLIR